MNWITLLTDFTEKDGYVALMKGVILRIAPDATIIDLSHEIPPQDVGQAAQLLGRSAPYFPAGTVHVCVVDPGVGTNRRGIIAQLGDQFFIGPDNGLMTLLYRQAQKDRDQIKIFSLENSAYQLSPVSHTFHGRDVFAPAAGYFVKGTVMSSFGRQVFDPVLLDIPEPVKTDQGWRGEVISIDAFGNLACNLELEQIRNPETIQIRIKDHMINGLSATFGDREAGQLVAVIDSFGKLSIGMVNGSAAQMLDVGVSEPVWLIGI